MAQHEKFYLNGTWQLKKADETLLCPVEIPGSVLSGLTEHGLLEDPFYRMNEYPIKGAGDEDGVISVQDAVLILTYYAKKSAGYAPDWDNL